MSIPGSIHHQKISKTNQKLIPARSNRRTPLCLLLTIGLSLAMIGAPGEPMIVQTPDPVESLGFSSDGSVLAAAFDGRVQLIHIPPPTLGAAQRFPVLGNFHGAACTLRSPEFSPTGLYYYGRRRDCGGVRQSRRQRSIGTRANRAHAGPNTIPIYDIATGTIARRLGPHAGYLTALRMSADGERLASAGDDGQVRIWSVADGRLTRSLRLPRLTDPRRLMQPFAFDPALELLAVHDWRDYYMVMIELETGTVLHKTEYPFRAAEQPLFVFARDGQTYFDGRRIRASRSGEPVSTIEFNFAMIPHRAAMSPDGKYLALLQRAKIASGARSASDSTSTVEVYSVASGALWSSFAVADRLESLAWHPDSSRTMLAAGGYSGRIYLREFE